MKKIFLGILAITMVTIIGIFPSITLAGEGNASDYMSGMGKQLGRGLINVISSPAEIPCTMRDDISASGGTGAFTGFGKGILFMVRRIVVGVSELLTFILPSEATIPPVCQKKAVV